MVVVVELGWGILLDHIPVQLWRLVQARGWGWGGRCSEIIIALQGIMNGLLFTSSLCPPSIFPKSEMEARQAKQQGGDDAKLANGFVCHIPEAKLGKRWEPHREKIPPMRTLAWLPLSQREDVQTIMKTGMMGCSQWRHSCPDVFCSWVIVMHVCEGCSGALTDSALANIENSKT